MNYISFVVFFVFIFISDISKSVLKISLRYFWGFVTACDAVCYLRASEGSTIEKERAGSRHTEYL